MNKNKMRHLHKRLIKNNQAYAAWHKHPAHKAIHWLSFLCAALIFTGAIISSIASTYPAEAQNNAQAALEANKKESKAVISPDSFLVKIKASSKAQLKSRPTPGDTGIASLNSINKSHGVKKFEQVGTPGKKSKTDAALFRWYKVTIDKQPTVPADEKGNLKNPGVEKAVEDYKKNSNVETAEPNYIIRADVVPNDFYYARSGSWGQTWPDMWGLQKINAAGAWDQTTGTTSIIVADIDTGVDRNHPDLTANMWVNRNEIPGNGIDDDNNKYVDDYYGWDFANNDNDPMDDMGHGSHTVGTIAGVGNNGTGVVGLNWTASVMALKFLNQEGSGDLYDGIKALQYAADMGARVSSNSWGCGCNSQVMDDAIKYEHDSGMVVVTAAGNNNDDALMFSPASADDAITVAATNHNDAKACFSNWGPKIDVAAPGGDSTSCAGISDYILSIKSGSPLASMCGAGNTIGGIYCIVRGTSMAAPHVAGLATLLLSKNPNLTNEEIRQIIRNGADDIGAPGKDSNFGFGRINAARSMTLTGTHPLTPYISSPRSRQISPLNLQITGSIGGPNFQSYILEYGLGSSPSTWTTVNTSSVQPISNGVLGNINTSLLTDGNYTVRLTATNTSGASYQFQVFNVVVDHFDNIIFFPSGRVSLSSVPIFGTAAAKNGFVLKNYTLSWSDGITWTSSGITLTNNGTQSVTNGILATWDTSHLTDGADYAIHLTVTATNGLSVTYPGILTADKDIIYGWPKFIDGVNRPPASPVFADLNGDGQKELIVGGLDGKLYAYKKDGSQMPGFPVNFDPVDPGNFHFEMDSINVTDLDQDGMKEIIAVADLIYGNPSNQLFIVKSDGTFYSGWPKPKLYLGDHSPTIGDLDGDGVKEIIGMEVSSFYGFTNLVLHAYHLNGTELVGFPKRLSLSDSDTTAPPSSAGTINLVDLDHDGNVEIAWSYYDRMYLFDKNGNVLPGWPYKVPATSTGFNVFYAASLGFGDFYGDGNLELFAQSNTFCGAGCTAGDKSVVYAWKKDGSVLSGFPKTTATDAFKGVTDSLPYAPLLLDLNGDGKDELIIGHPLTVFDYTGKKTLLAQPDVNDGFAVSDINGDGKLKIAFGDGSGINIVNTDGTAVLAKRLGGLQTSSPPVFADMDNNGKMEIAVIGHSYGSNRGETVFLWEIGGTGASTKEWPMFAHDPARRGALDYRQGLDITAPTVSVTFPSSGAIVSGISTVSVSANDNIGINKVELYVNGSLKSAKTSGSSPYIFSLDTTQFAKGPISVTAKAYDGATNAATSSVVNLTVDNTTAPTVSITSPLTGVTVSNIINVNVSATDNSALSSVELLVNDIPYASTTPTSSSNYSFALNTWGFANGSIKITAKAKDASNNITQTSINVNVNNPPDVLTVSPSSLSFSSVVGTAPASKSVVISHNGNITFNWQTFWSTATWCHMNLSSGQLAPAGSVTVNISVDPLSSAGTVNCAIRVGKLNNTAVYTEINMTYAVLASGTTPPPSDTTAPTVSISSPLNGATVSGTVPVSVGATDNVAVTKVDLLVNGVVKSSKTSGTSPYAFSWDTTQTVNGSATLMAIAYDAAGNGASSTLVSVTVSNPVAVPKPYITLPPAALNFVGITGGLTPAPKSVTLTNSGTADLNWTSSIDPGADWCSLLPTSGKLLPNTNTALSVSVSAPSNIGSWTCYIRITDPNASNLQQTITVNYSVSPTPDTVAPTTSINSPKDKAVVARSTNVNIEALAGDDRGVKYVEIYAGNKLVCSDSAAPYICSWSITGKPNQTYQIYSKAYDGTNITTSAIITVTAK